MALIRFDKFGSPLRTLVLISFICENDLSTDAVPTGSDKRKVVSLSRLGSNAISVSLVASS